MKCTILVLRQSGMRHSGRVILACAIVVCAIVARNPKKSGGGGGGGQTFSHNAALSACLAAVNLAVTVRMVTNGSSAWEERQSALIAYNQISQR